MVATDGYQHPVADPPVPRPAAQYKRRLARAATARAEEEALTQRNPPSALQRCTVEARVRSPAGMQSGIRSAQDASGHDPGPHDDRNIWRIWAKCDNVSLSSRNMSPVLRTCR